MPGDKLKSYLHLHFIVFVWGFTAVLGALITLDAMPLVWFRMSIAVGLIFIYTLFAKTPLKIPPRTLIGFLAAGLIIALHWFTFFEAIKVSNISVTLACLSTGAFFASILESVFYGKRIVWYELIMGLAVVLALSIVVYGDYLQLLIADIKSQPFSLSAISKSLSSVSAGKPANLSGILLALSSALLSAIFSIINGKYAKEYNPVAISFYELLGGVAFFSVYLLFSGSFTAEFFNVSAEDWGWLFILGSFCTAYAFIASVQVMKFLSPYTVMLTINMEPIYGIILAVLIFPHEEKMSWTFYLGAAIILTTVIFNGILKNRVKKAN